MFRKYMIQRQMTAVSFPSLSSSSSSSSVTFGHHYTTGMYHSSYCSCCCHHDGEISASATATAASSSLQNYHTSTGSTKSSSQKNRFHMQEKTVSSSPSNQQQQRNYMTNKSVGNSLHRAHQSIGSSTASAHGVHHQCHTLSFESSKLNQGSSINHISRSYSTEHHNNATTRHTTHHNTFSLSYTTRNLIRSITTTPEPFLLASAEMQYGNPGRRRHYVTNKRNLDAESGPKPKKHDSSSSPSAAAELKNLKVTPEKNGNNTSGKQSTSATTSVDAPSEGVENQKEISLPKSDAPTKTEVTTAATVQSTAEGVNRMENSDNNTEESASYSTTTDNIPKTPRLPTVPKRPRKILAIGGAGATGKLLSYRIAWSPYSPSISILGKKDTKGAQISQRLDASSAQLKKKTGDQFHEYHTVDIQKEPEKLRKYVRQSDLVLYLVAPFDSTEVADICLEEGVHYIDMSTDPDFINSFAERYHEEALKKKIVMVSGASISPGLSSCIIDKYAAEFDALEEVEMHYTQGNRSIKGRNSLQVALGRIGQKISYLDNGVRKEICTGEKLKRVSFPGFPKQRLLSSNMEPAIGLLRDKYSSLRTIKFYSGFELTILQYLSFIMAHLSKWGFRSDWKNLSGFLTKFVNSLRWFGSDEGAFQVIMRGRKRSGSSRSPAAEVSHKSQSASGKESSSDITTQKEEFRIASSIIGLDGNDTQLPITAPYVLTEKLMKGELKPGAYPCIGLFSLKEYLDALKNYGVNEVRDGCGTYERIESPLVAQAIGSNYWLAVPNSIKQFYSSRGGFASGMIVVNRSKGRFSQWIADFLGLPQQSHTMRLAMESSNYVFRRFFVEEGSLHLKYTKPFASSLFVNSETKADGLVREDFGNIEFGFRFNRVPAMNGAYGFEYKAMKAKLGSLPWPLFLTIRPSGKVIPTANPNRWYIESSWTSPLLSGGPVVHYQGMMELRGKCIGIDLGGCVSTSLLEKEDYNSHAFLKAPPVLGSFAAIREIVDLYGAENVYIVTQASFPVALRKSEWLGYHNFFERTGVQRENVIFLENSEQKAEACRLNHIRTFIDNRQKRLEGIRTEIPEMTRLFWLRALPSDDVDFDEIPSSDLSNKIVPCESWDEALKKLKESHNKD